MEKKNALTKFLAIAGTALVWFPILAPLLLSVILFIERQTWHFDYLMPAELFFSFLMGSGLLLWATLRAHSHVKLVAWGLGVAVLVMFAGQALAVVSGLASGEREPTGLLWGLVLALLAVYVLGILLVGISGASLIKNLF